MTEKLSDEQRGLLRERICHIRHVLADSTPPGGTPPTLIAATKTVGTEAIRFVINECGITDIGENKVQELLSKYDALRDTGVRFHFIGRLQTNKVRQIIDKVCLIHSLDSIPLAEEIERCAALRSITANVLIELNCGGEESKGGIKPEELNGFLGEIDRFPHISVRGIMPVMPYCPDKCDYEKYFIETSRIFIDISAKKLHNIDGSVFSAGMSDNYDMAAHFGATAVRLGRAIFGERTATV